MQAQQESFKAYSLTKILLNLNIILIYKGYIVSMTNKNKSINPIAVGVAGAVVGAGAAIVGAVALKDEKNRKKLGKIVNDIKEQVDDKKVDTKEAVNKAREEIKENGIEKKSLKKKS